MNKKISLYKKIKIFREFRRIIKKNKNQLEELFSARVDNAYRIYTVINIPQNIISEPYNIRKSDIDKISENYIRELTINISNFLDSKNLKETYDFYDIKKVDKYSYLIIIGFSLFRSNSYYNIIRYCIIPLLLIIILLLVIIFV